MARIGTFHLCEAILDVLLAEHPSGYGLGAAAIGKRTGIYRSVGKIGLNDAIVSGYLNELFAQKKVKRKKQVNNKNGWALSDDEYQRRRDDI